MERDIWKYGGIEFGIVCYVFITEDNREVRIYQFRKNKESFQQNKKENNGNPYTLLIEKKSELI